MKPELGCSVGAVALIPVIEMMPTDYALADRPSPSGNAPDEYFGYWSACLADAGITGLQPVGLWHVPVRQLTETHTLERLVHEQRWGGPYDENEDALDTFSDPDEYLLAFSGGYALRVNGQAVCTPRCCGDLTDIAHWQEAADYRGAEWVEVWIGHPGIQARFDDGQLVLRDKDSSGDSQTEWDGEIAIYPEALQEAIGQARQELQDFSKRLLPVIGRLVTPEQAIHITEILTTYCEGLVQP